MAAIGEGKAKGPRGLPVEIPSPDLAAIVGSEPLTRAQVTKRVWAYINAQRLQDPIDRRIIRSDDLLGRVLGSAPINMLAIAKALSPHLSRPPKGEGAR